MVYNLPLRLRFTRIRSRLSQKEVAMRVGLDSSTISSYENGNSAPSLETLSKLADVYATTADHLLGLKKEECICIDDLTEEQKTAVYFMVNEFKSANKERSL